MKEQVVSAAANAKATGQDARLAVLNTMATAANMGLYQQESTMSSTMMDKRTFMTASQQANQKISSFNSSMTGGLDMDMKILYASEMAKENGTTNEEELIEFMFTLVVLGILASLILPKPQEIKTEREGANIQKPASTNTSTWDE